MRFGLSVLAYDCDGFGIVDDRFAFAVVGGQCYQTAEYLGAGTITFSYLISFSYEGPSCGACLHVSV